MGHSHDGARRKPTRVLGYVRVSGDPFGRADDSLEAQQAEITRLCERDAYPAPILRAEIVSASGDELDARPILKALLAEVRAGDLIVVTKQDRLSRNTLVYLQIVRELEKRGASFYSIAEKFDPSTSEGRFAATIMAAVAEQEAARIKDRMVGSRLRMRDAGLWVEGPPPLGYRVEERRLVVEPSEAAVIREAARRCLLGESLTKISRVLPLLPSRRRKAWDKKSLGSLLRSRVYLGEQRDSHGSWRPVHEAILDAQTWQQAQEALDGRRNHRGPAGSGAARTASWLLPGLAFCAACGGAMGSAYGEGARPAKGEPRSYIDYYSCTERSARKACKASLVRVVEADAVVAEELLARLRALRSHAATPVADRPEGAELAPDFEAQRDALEQRRRRVLGLYERGHITVGELDARLAVVAAERTELAAAEARHVASARSKSGAGRRALLAQLGQIERAWTKSTVADRRKILRIMATKVLLLKGAPPVIAWRSDEELLTDV